jgi:hypothetical protein
MTKYEVIKKEWVSAAEVMLKSSGFQRILWGVIDAENYIEILKQFYFYERALPQVNKLATGYFSGTQVQFLKEFNLYMQSKIEQTKLLLNDLEMLGVDQNSVKNQNPLPSTMAFTAFAFYQIQQDNPLSYLGNLFHNEAVYRRYGKEMIIAFERKGISRQAMSFLCGHAIVDGSHERLIEKFINELIVTPEELDAAVYTAKASAYLFGQLIDQAILTLDQPIVWEKSSIELEFRTELNNRIEVHRYVM